MYFSMQQTVIIIIIIMFFAHQHKAAGVKTKQKTTAATTFYSAFIVLRKEIAFPRCRAMDRRWNRKTVSLFIIIIIIIS